jgi:hypothetical protein
MFRPIELTLHATRQHLDLAIEDKDVLASMPGGTLITDSIR